MIDTLSSLLALMKSRGARRFYAKKLAANDNSKNQVYLGGDFSALNILPHQGVYTDAEEMAGSKRDRAKAEIRLFWIDEDGCYPAPNAQLILYPKYPEVRMSGFLKGCANSPSDIMRVRDEGRILFLGISDDGVILCYAVGRDHPLAHALHAKGNLTEVGVFLEIPAGSDEIDTRQLLLARLTEVYQRSWIPSQKLGADGVCQPYRAANGGGYTLEAELGIAPNGYSEPDYLGWEIKQYGVSDFRGFRSKSPVTLMTPEPTGGLYRDQGVAVFMQRYGYPDKSGKIDRINFGGIYAVGRDFHNDTSLRLELLGYDREKGVITDMSGGVALLSRGGEVAALWGFAGIMDHWNRKHAKAAYIPSLFRKPPPEYSYGPRVLLCERTDFSLFLRALSESIVYYDPAIKVEGASSLKPTTKRRSQFRVRHAQLVQMYHRHEYVDLIANTGLL